MSTHEIIGLQGAHSGETIFVIGSGPTLGGYSEDLRSELGRRVCIGVNRTQYMVDLKYFISSYFSENALARIVNDKTFTIHTRDRDIIPLVDEFPVIKRVYSEKVEDLSDVFNIDNPHLVTRNNVIFLATNLALIMGARRIVYVGYEQRNGLHFYNTDDAVLNCIVSDMAVVIARYSGVLGADHQYETPLNIMRALTADPDILKDRPFYTTDHGQLLTEWIVSLREKFNREVYSCAEDSVVVDAGAKYMPLEAVLNEF